MRCQSRYIAFPLLAELVAACGSLSPRHTGYVKADPLWTSRYGYSDKPLGGDEFSVGATALVSIETQTSEEVTAILLIRVLPRAASYPPDAIDAVETIAGFARRLEG